MVKKHVTLTIILLLGCLSSTAQTFKFKQIKTDNVCLVQLMENITKVVSNSHWWRNAQYHHLSIEVHGADTLLVIHSNDLYGFYSTISKNNFFGVYIMSGHEFYIDSSLANLFYYTGKSFKKKYNPKYGEGFDIIVHDGYDWLFKKTFCGIDLCGTWTMENLEHYKIWYNLELDPNCFCDYKNMSIDFVEDEPDLFEDE